jgi:ABC-type polysaccharide/polyol phosphate export permease
MISTITATWRQRVVVGHFVSLLLTSSYRTKSLGFLWALLDPLLFMCVYYLVFGYLIAHRPPEFMIHIFIGVISFRFLNRAMSQGASILRSQAGVIKEISFPRAALPVSVMLSRLFDFAAGWLVAIPLAFFFGLEPNAAWLVLPLLIVIHAVFVTGICFITAYIGVFFADIENILDVGLRLWFYMTPILYPISVVQNKIDELGQPLLFELYMMNPMTNMVLALGAPVEHAMLPELRYVVGSAVAAALSLLVGLFVFSRAEGQIAKYV